MQDFIKKSNIRDENHIEILNEIQNKHPDFILKFNKKSYLDIQIILDDTLSMLIEMKSYDEILKKIKQKVYNWSDSLLIDFIIKIESVKSDFLEVLLKNRMIKSYIRSGIFYTTKEITLSDKTTKEVIKEVSPNIAVLTELLNAYNIKLNGKEIKSAISEMPKFDEWLNEIKNSKGK